MTTDDRDGTLLPFPTVSLPPSFDAGASPPPGGDGDGETDDGSMIPVGSWPMLPDVSDMTPPRHMSLAGVPEAEDDDDQEDDGTFVPPAPADPDNPRGRDAAVMGMAVLAAVGVSCAHGMWQLTQGVRARAEHRKAIADKARTAADAAADKAAAKRVQPSPEYGRGQKNGGGRSGSGSGGGSGGGKSGGGGSGSGSKTPATFRSNGPKKGSDGPSGGSKGGGGSKGPGGPHKGGQGPHKGAGGSGGGGKGPNGGSGSGGKGPKGPNSGNSGGSKGSKDSKGNDNKSSKDGKSSKSSDTKSAKDTKAGKDSAATKNKPKLPEPVGPWKDKPENKPKSTKGKDTAAKDSPDKKTDPKKPETKKADPKAEKVDLTKKPKADSGKDKGKAEKPPLYDKTRKTPSTHKPDGDGKWKKPPETPVNKTEKNGGAKKTDPKSDGPASASGKPGEDPGAAKSGAAGPGDGWEFSGPPPGGMPGMDGMRPPPAYTDPEFKVWLERDDPPPPEPTPAGAITRGAPALPAGTSEEAPAASSTPSGPAAPAVPPQRGARFVSAPVKADTQYRDAELTVYDVIDADADMAEEITAGVDEATAAADGCERLVTKLEALHAKVVELKVPGVLEGMVVRLIEKTGEVKAKAEAIAAALPRASEAIATAGDNTAAIHRNPADVTKDMGHTRPAERDYNME